MPICLFALPFSAWSGRPLVVDDAMEVSRGHIELELGRSHVKPDRGGREQKFPVIAVGFGLYERLEGGFSIQRANDDRKGSRPVKGFEDLHLTSKYRFLAGDSILPALAFSLDVKTLTANRRKGLSSGRWDETLLLIASKSFASLALHLNLGYVIVDSPSRENLKNRIRGGLALEWPFAQHWTFVGEAFGSSRETEGEHNVADFQVGVRYLLAPQIALDAAAGRSFRSTGAKIQGTVGFTWTYDTRKILAGP